MITASYFVNIRISSKVEYYSPYNILILYSIGFFTQLQRTFYAKKVSIMTRKNPFGTKVLYRLLFIHIFHYSVTFYCLLNCCSNLISHFNHANFGGEKLKWHFSCDID